MNIRTSLLIGKLFGTISNLAADDFTIHAVYDTRINWISVDVYKGAYKDDMEFDDLSAYITAESVITLEDELIQLHKDWRNK